MRDSAPETAAAKHPAAVQAAGKDPGDALQGLPEAAEQALEAPPQVHV